MTISINDLTSGTGLLINGDIWLVLEYQHVKPGKGSAFARVRLKNIKTEQVLEKTFRSSDKLDEVTIDENRMQLMYRSGNSFHFMDQTSFEEVVVPEEILGDGVHFLQDHADVTAFCHNHKVLKILLPNFITAEIIQSEPGLKGDSSKSNMKPATIDTGATVQVPLFINTGDFVKIDTRSGTYVERVQK